MPTHYRDPLIVCDSCDATVDRPATAESRALYEAGWRARGNPNETPSRLAPHTHLWSCPVCPAVAIY